MIKKTLAITLNQLLLMSKPNLLNSNANKLILLNNNIVFGFSEGSANKKFTSTFKIRSRLAQFFKHIHPDQMNQAPTKIKQQNMRSLKNFNQYIDSINQQKSMQGKLLKFYIAQKMNHKSKKFYSFNLQLPNLQSFKINQQKAQRLLDDIVNALNSKFKQSQQGPTDKKSKSKKITPIQQQQNQVKFQSDEQRIKREQQTIGPFQKHKNYKDKLVQQRLKNEINSKYMQSQKNNLQTKLRKNVSFADTKSSRPMMWARLSMQQSGIYKDYQNVLNSLIDPKLIYFHHKLTDFQIQQFKKKLLPGGMDPLTLRNNDYINDVCEQMESFNPPFSFFVSTHYSGNQIPGFFTVPYNFKPKQLKQKFIELKPQIQLQQQTYIQYYEYFREVEKQLKQQNNIKVNLKQFKGNNDISEKILMMKRLSRYQISSILKQNLPTFYPMTQQQYQITLSHYAGVDNNDSKEYNDNKEQIDKTDQKLIDQQTKKVKTVLRFIINQKTKVFMLVNFRDSDLQEVINQIHSGLQIKSSVIFQQQSKLSFQKQQKLSFQQQSKLSKQSSY